MRRALALTAVALLSATSACSRQPQPGAAPSARPAVAPAAAVKTPPPTVGAIAPDFTLPGATRYGVLQKPASLSDYRGKTVVLAFFFRARTRG